MRAIRELSYLENFKEPPASPRVDSDKVFQRLVRLLSEENALYMLEWNAEFTIPFQLPVMQDKLFM